MKEFWYSQIRILREPKMLVLKEKLFKITINNQFHYNELSGTGGKH